METREIRERFLQFYRKKGHEIVESASLIPMDDPTLLFTNAGMVQFKRLFLGEEKRGYTRAVTSQKCVRAGGKHNDLENVGYTGRHHTFFEMLGNFSFGDYFKEEAISWAWELLTDVYGLDPDKLYVSIYRDDEEAFDIWREQVGVPSERIVRLGEKDNFWSMGDTGPCGPCSEIYIDQGPAFSCGRADCGVGCDCDRYLEIYNLVFTQFDRAADGTLSPLPQKNIDTGMGLERLAAVVQGASSNYETDILRHLISRIEDLSGIPYKSDGKDGVAFKVIADHARAAAFLIGDGIMPSNEGRGYVLRRIIRRAIRYGRILNLKDSFFFMICGRVIDLMGGDYPELERSRKFIEGVVENEERRFSDTLNYSMRVFEEELAELRKKGGTVISGEVAFKLYDTFGLSLDMVEDVARDEGLTVDMDGYGKAMARQRAMSQESWKGSGEEEIPETYRKLLGRGVKSIFEGYASLEAEARIVGLLVGGKEAESVEAGTEAEVILDRTPFYGRAGGQVGDIGIIEGEELRFVVEDTLKVAQKLIIHKGRVERGSITRGEGVRAVVDEKTRRDTACNHSATHLLHAALRHLLGDHVKQAGSLVTPQRFRFDFSHFTQVGQEKLLEIEALVNSYIRENLAVSVEAMSKEEAMKTGAMAIFEERYGEQVRVVKVGEGMSMELCGGTHTARTGDIGLFRIISEGAVAANVRRIEAVTGQSALIRDQQQEMVLKRACSVLKTSPERLEERIGHILREQKEKEREVESLKAKLMTKKSDDFLSELRQIGDVNALAREIDVASPKELRESGDRIRDKVKSGIILLGAGKEGTVMLNCVVTKDLVGRFRAGDIIKQISPIVGGKGGGRPDMAQGGGNLPDKLGEAFEAFYDLVEKGGS